MTETKFNESRGTLAWYHPRGAAILASKIDGITEDECYDFQTIYEFLRDNPNYVTQARGKRTKPNISTDSGVLELAERWYDGRSKTVTVTKPKTIIDNAVGAVLIKQFNWDMPYAAKALDLHLKVMAAENVIGTLLEKYIASHMEHYGWIWCAGEIVRSVDFLKKNEDGFIPLQVKNRSNSENSSSAAIRNGTDIIKWHRINAYTGVTYWDKFPEPELREVLTEQGFLDYIQKELKFDE